MNSRELGTNITNLKFKNNHVVYENFIKCTIKDYEFNLSYNPTLLSGSQALLYPYSSSNSGSIFWNVTGSEYYGDLKDFATGSISGSEFSPYLSTVGLYNDAGDLLAVAKMAAPMPISSNTDMTFLVKWDTQWTPKPYFISSPSPSPSLSPTPSKTPSVSRTPSKTPSVTPSLTATPTATPSISSTPSATPSISITPSATPSISITPSLTATPTVTPSLTPSISITPSKTPTPTPTLPATYQVTVYLTQQNGTYGQNVVLYSKQGVGGTLSPLGTYTAGVCNSANLVTYINNVPSGTNLYIGPKSTGGNDLKYVASTANPCGTPIFPNCISNVMYYANITADTSIYIELESNGNVTC
jgi:hypothetical protein